MPDNDSQENLEPQTQMPPISAELDTQTPPAAEEETPGGEEAGGETPGKDFSKLLNRESMKRASEVKNLNGKLDAIMAKLEKGPITEAQRRDHLSEAAALLKSDAINTLRDSNPEVVTLLENITEALREARGTGKVDQEQLQTLQSLQAQVQHQAYWSQYPADYQEAFDEKAQKLWDSGRYANTQALQAAAGLWFTEVFLPSKSKSGASPGAGSSPRRQPVIPAGSGARQNPNLTPKELLASGKGNIGGYKLTK